jgi:hypothetical protein
MITKEEYNKALDIVLKYKEQLRIEMDAISNALIDTDFYNQEIHLFHPDLSARAYHVLINVLDKSYSDTILLKELFKLNMRDLRRQRMCGKKTIDEIVNLCERAEIIIPAFA